jgi:hypothetical protein
MDDDLSVNELAGEGTSSGPASRRVLAAAVIVLIVIGALIAVVGFAAGSTAACSHCHVLQAAALTRSPHTGIACERCHFASRGSVHGRVDVLTRMLPSSVGGIRLEGAGRPMGSGACISCHPTWVAGGVVTKNGLRIDHTRCTVAVPCENCHGQSILGLSTRKVRNAVMTDCVSCHVEKNAPLDCPTCHVGRIPKTGTANKEFARTHGADWKKMHGTGDLRSCAGCHTTDSCKPCHRIVFPHPKNFGATHGRVAIAVGAESCLSCHEKASYCSGCHGIDMPHPAGFLQRHGDVASSPTDPTCAVCHVLNDCDQCHQYHVHPGGTQPPIGRFGGF